MNTAVRVLEVATPDCVADDFNGEVVVLNVVSGVYFSLQDLAAAVWRDLAAGHSVGSLISGIGRTDELLAAATARLIDNFEQSGLMRSARPRRLETVEPDSVALVHAGEARLTFETYEDLKDLILSDPIHDADTQLGWPALRHADKIQANPHE